MNDLPEGFTRDDWERLKAKHAQMNAEYERAGGFHQWVLRGEAERIAQDVGAYLASRPKGENAACSAWNWAFDLSVELAQINGWHVSDPRRREAERQVLLAFEHGAASLPLLQSSGVEWGAAELPSDWHYTLLLRRDGLRAWAVQHAPSILETALLAGPAAQHPETVGTEAASARPQHERGERITSDPADGVVRHSANGKRTQLLDAEIEAAKREATDPSSAPSVFAVLQRYAEAKRAPFLGFVDGEGCKYQTPDGPVKFLTLAALRKRMARAANGR